MKESWIILMLLLAGGLPSCAQEANSTQSPPPSSAARADQQTNPSTANQDTSPASTDQATRPAGTKSTTLIGCLSGPAANGNFTLNSMQHRTGVEVLGPEDLKNAVGNKVKLTGTWQPASEEPLQQKPGKPAWRFQATQVEVLSQHCQAPSPTTPNKKKWVGPG